MKAIKKAQNGTAKYSDPKPLLDSLSNVRKKLDAEKASVNAKHLNDQRRYNKAKKDLSKKTTPKAKDGKWIQSAVKGMRKDKPCTGPKLGSKTCPPGSKRYNLAKTFSKMNKKK